jgi:hypothetical protein
MDPGFENRRVEKNRTLPKDFVTEIGNRKEGVGGSSPNLVPY